MFGASQPTPGQAQSSQEQVNLVHAIAQDFKEAMESVMEKFGELQTSGGGPAVHRSEKMQAISSLDFKHAPPTIKDDDPDLHCHDQIPLEVAQYAP